MSSPAFVVRFWNGGTVMLSFLTTAYYPSLGKDNLYFPHHFQTEMFTWPLCGKYSCSPVLTGSRYLYWVLMCVGHFQENNTSNIEYTQFVFILLEVYYPCSSVTAFDLGIIRTGLPRFLCLNQVLSQEKYVPRFTTVTPSSTFTLLLNKHYKKNCNNSPLIFSLAL